jgi:hypothetical protein
MAIVPQEWSVRWREAELGLLRYGAVKGAERREEALEEGWV